MLNAFATLMIQVLESRLAVPVSVVLASSTWKTASWDSAASAVEACACTARRWSFWNIATIGSSSSSVANSENTWYQRIWRCHLHPHETQWDILPNNNGMDFWIWLNIDRSMPLSHIYIDVSLRPRYGVWASTENPFWLLSGESAIRRDCSQTWSIANGPTAQTQLSLRSSLTRILISRGRWAGKANNYIVSRSSRGSRENWWNSASTGWRSLISCEAIVKDCQKLWISLGRVQIDEFRVVCLDQVKSIDHLLESHRVVRGEIW